MHPRPRNLPTVWIVAVLMLLVAGCGVDRSSTGGTTTTSDVGGPTTTAGAGTTGTDDLVDTNYSKLLTWHEVSMAVPETYDLFDLTDDTACVSPSDPADYDGHCDGIELVRGAAIDTASNGTPYDPEHGDLAWWHGTTKPPCNPTIDDTSMVETSKLVNTRTATIDGRTADQASWEVTCTVGVGTLSIDAWYLEAERLLFVNRGGSIMNPIVVEHTGIDR